MNNFFIGLIFIIDVKVKKYDECGVRYALIYNDL